MKVIFDAQKLQKISLFEKITKARVKDFFEQDDKLFFIVLKGDLWKALGKASVNLKKIEQLFKTKVRIVEYEPEVDKFIANLMYPAKINSIAVDDDIVTIESKDTKSRGYMIGRGGSNLRKVENIVNKFFTVKEIKVV